MALFNPEDIKASESPKTIAVAAAEDDAALSAVAKAYALGLAVPILVGNEKKIRKIAEETSVDISSFEIVGCGTAPESAAAAIKLIRENKADILMKGLIQTADLLRAVLNKEQGLRGGGVLSHVCVLDSPTLNKRFLMTDAVMVPYPDLKMKAALIKNAVKVAVGLGIENPKIAVLAAVEVVNPDMPATLDAAALTMMNRRGQLAGCIVDGPLSLDLALSEASAHHKGVSSEVAGHADILLVPDIDTGNTVLKSFTLVGNCLFGGLVIGAQAPIILNSRADTDISKLFSIYCAEAVCQRGHC